MISYFLHYFTDFHDILHLFLILYYHVFVLLFFNFVVICILDLFFIPLLNRLCFICFLIVLLSYFCFFTIFTLFFLILILINNCNKINKITKYKQKSRMSLVLSKPNFILHDIWGFNMLLNPLLINNLLPLIFKINKSVRKSSSLTILFEIIFICFRSKCITFFLNL